MCNMLKHFFPSQARNKLSQLQESHQEVNKSIEEYNEALNGIHGGSLTNLADMSEGLGQTERSNYGAMVKKNI